MEHGQGREIPLRPGAASRADAEVARPDPALAQLLGAVEARYGMEVERARVLTGGYESDVIALETDRGPFALRVAPAWRTVEELAWAFELAAFAAEAIPEVVRPLPARDGALVFACGSRPLSVWPFVEGRTLDRGDAEERDSAAGVLARLHRVLPAWPALRPRPPLSPAAPPRSSTTVMVRLDDAELDAFEARFEAVSPERAPIHADFYRGNLLCRGRRVVGVIDWDDCRLGTLERELAWSVWELAKADDEEWLDPERAARFLDAYAAGGGPVPVEPRERVVPLIRSQLRTEILYEHAVAEAGFEVDRDYLRKQTQAFWNLKHQRL